VQIEGVGARRDLVLPTNDTLFSSGTLGRYSKMLGSVMEAGKPAETAAD
jgi:NADH-quinone oxidoreductase subunit G